MYSRCSGSFLTAFRFAVRTPRSKHPLRSLPILHCVNVLHKMAWKCNCVGFCVENAMAGQKCFFISPVKLSCVVPGLGNILGPLRFILRPEHLYAAGIGKFQRTKDWESIARDAEGKFGILVFLKFFQTRSEKLRLEKWCSGVNTANNAHFRPVLLPPINSVRHYRKRRSMVITQLGRATEGDLGPACFCYCRNLITVRRDDDFIEQA